MKKNLDDEQQAAAAAATQKQTISLPNKNQKQEEKTEENWQFSGQSTAVASLRT